MSNGDKQNGGRGGRQVDVNVDTGDGLVGGISGGTMLKAGLIGGGVYVAVKVLTESPALGHLKDEQSKAMNQLAKVYESPDSFSDGELEAIADNYKNHAIAENENLPEDERVSISAWEQQLTGEPPAERAAAWITVYDQVLKKRIADETSQHQVVNLLQDAAPDWVLNYWRIISSAVTAAAILAVIKRIIDFGRRGGGGTLDLLSSLAETVREGIFGRPDTVDTIQTPAPPAEDVVLDSTPTGEPIISGSLRAVGQAVGLTIDMMIAATEVLGVAADAILSLGEAGIAAVLEATSLTVQDVQQRPEVVLAAAIVFAVVAVGVAAATGSTGGVAAPIAFGAGGALVAGALGLMGVDFNKELMLPAGQDTRASLGL